MFKNYNDKKILVTGSQGFVGRNFAPLLDQNCKELLLPTRSDYDLLEQNDVRALLNDCSPDIVFHFAGQVGGLQANMNSPADYCYKNLLMQTTMMHESFEKGVEKFITLIGGCSYPNDAESPIKEESMWLGYPHMGASAYSTAKRMNIVMSNAYRQQYGFNSIVLVPGNIYGPWDNFDLENSHVIPALIRKYHEATNEGLEKITAWGS